jgi:hypothetical protein
MFSMITISITAAKELLEIFKSVTPTENQPKIADIINSLKPEAIQTCREISSELRKMRGDLRESGIDLAKSVTQLYKDLKWYNAITKLKIKSLERKFYAVYRTLAGFVDDVNAVMICSNSTERLGVPLIEAREKKKQLDELVNSEKPMNEIIDEMLLMNEMILAQLQGDNEPG